MGAEWRAEWRAACRALASERAHAEAQELWGAAGAAVLPFEHRWEHVQQVVALALRLGAELHADAEVIEAAAWLHDIRKLEPKHALAGAAEAATFLPRTDFPAGKIAATVDAIARHEGFFRPQGAPPLTPLEAAVLWDADKISKLGIGPLALTLGSPYVKGRTLAERRRYVDEFARTVLRRSVESMNTEPGRRLAAHRYHSMIRALDAWAHEELEEAAGAPPAPMQESAEGDLD